MPALHLQPSDRARLHSGAEHLHRLGPVRLAEFLAELGERIGGTPACLGLLTEYGRRAPARMIAAGSGRSPRRPSGEVRR